MRNHKEPTACDVIADGGCVTCKRSMTGLCASCAARLFPEDCNAQPSGEAVAVAGTVLVCAKCRQDVFVSSKGQLRCGRCDTDFGAPSPPAPLGGLTEGLLAEQLQYEQAQAREAHAALTEAGAPTNGDEGHGKRNELTLAQRIRRLTAPRAEGVDAPCPFLPCPFCGAAAREVPEHAGRMQELHPAFNVECSNDRCDVQPSANSAEAWNRRAALTAAAPKVEENGNG